MKTLIWHTTSLRTEAGWKKQDKRRMVRRYPALTETRVKKTRADNSITVFVTIEKTDRFVDLSAVAKSISEAGKRIGVQSVVLIGFGHLSSELAPLREATEIIGNLAAELAKTNVVTIIDGGYDKSLIMEVPRHHYNCAYRQFRADLTVGQLFDVYGEEYLRHMAGVHREALNRLVKRLGVTGRTADIGCADSSLGFDMGVDISDKMIERAKAAGKNVMKADARMLPFSDREFDNALCANLVNYLNDADLRVALREWARIARRIIIVNEWPFVHGNTMELEGFFRELQRLVIPRSPRDIIGIAQETGLERMQEIQEPIDTMHDLYAITLEKK